MQTGTLAVGSAFVASRTTRNRITVLIAAVLLVLAMFVIVQQVDTSPAGASVGASATVGGDNAQIIDIRQAVCPILISVRNAFANTPFGGFVTPILNSLIQSFGCAPS